MKNNNLFEKYNPKNIEENIYDFWEKNNFFKYKISKKNNFCIVLPPPNITGNLHIGHSFQQTIMDFIVRFERMNGKNVLWQAGLDHAGIATQILLEKKLKNNYKIFKNEKLFLKKANIWKQKLSNSIIYQMKRLGNSIYWKDIRFTMDNKFKNSVKFAFIKLYKDKLIYKKKKIVNWDINIKSAISDLEVDNKRIKKKFFYIKYEILERKNKYIISCINDINYILATSAIIINFNHYKYKDFENCKVKLPIINRIIPIIFNYTNTKNKDLNECENLTPAYNIKHYDIAINNNLDIIESLNLNGKTKKLLKITNNNSKYKKKINLPNILSNKLINNVDKIILNKLNLLKLIYKEKYLNIDVPYNFRTKSYIKQIITDQWYIKTKKLSNIAIKVVKKKYIKFIPEKYEKIYINWLNNIQDWCISRQILWGHKIPAWYDKNKNIYVGNNKKEIITKYKLKNNIKLYKEKDVLDTWFSSSLWTFSSLGWPKKTKKLKNFHPTNLIISGHDIIFFWISKMIMMTLFIFNKDKKIENKIPFKKVYITGLINDKYGKKMSKSNKNIINPIDIIDGISINKFKKKKYKNNNNYYNLNSINPCGADALRISFLSLSTNNNKNINFNLSKVYGYKNFCNKLWNSSIFILKNCKNIKNLKLNFNKNLLLNKWILSNLHEVIKQSLIFINEYKFNKYIELIYNFFWNDFCNWYIEISKYFFKKNKNNKVKIVLIYVLSNLIKLLHPVIPFITEKIWQLIKKNFNLNKKKYNTITLQKFPKFNLNYLDKKYNENFEIIKNIIYIFRKKNTNFKKCKIKTINIITKINDNIEIIYKNKYIIKFILKINKIYINKFFKKTSKIIKINI